MADSTRLLQDVAGVTRTGVARWVAIDEARADYVNGALVTGRFFDVLGVDAVLGRRLGEADDREGAEPVVVISHGLWQRRYGGARDVTGRLVRLGERPVRIVGVMPPGLDYPTGVEMWRAAGSVAASEPFGFAARLEVDLVARLRPGVTVAQAASELAALTRRFEENTAPGEVRGLVPVVQTLPDVIVGGVRPALLTLVAAVALVLIIATANCSNLLLARSEQRRAELALRAALGAGRGRIVFQQLGESLWLGALGGALGLALAWIMLPALLRLLPDGLPRVESVNVDLWVVVVAGATAAVAAALAGLVPSLTATRGDLTTALRAGSLRPLSSAHGRGQRALVVVQIALAVTTLAAAGLLGRSLLRLQALDIGLPVGRLLLVEMALPQATRSSPERHAQFLDEAVARLEAIPAISAATPVNNPPFSGLQGWDVPTFTAEGQSAGRAAVNPALSLESVHPNYFETVGVRLTRGRRFTSGDREGGLAVAIVSDDVAARTWPGEDPIGKRLKMGDPESPDPWRTVVGVAAPTRYRELSERRPTLYLPAAQFLMTAQMLAVRTSAPVAVVAPAIRARIQGTDAAVRVMRVVPFSEMLDRPLARPRFNVLLLGIFATASVLLAAIGCYAALAASVRGRFREIGVRLALGATSADVGRLVVGESLRLAAAGSVIGLAGSIASARLLRGLLFEVHPLDPVALLAAASVLLVAAAIAAALPAHRATRVDPLAVLRAE